MGEAVRGAILPDVRPMSAVDIEAIVSADSGPWWRRDRGYWVECVNDQTRGSKSVVVARLAGEVAGYAYLNWISQYPRFLAAGVPKIADSPVAERLRRNGVATTIISHFESVAVAAGRESIGVGVGLTRTMAGAAALCPSRFCSGRKGRDLPKPGGRARLRRSP